MRILLPLAALGLLALPGCGRKAEKQATSTTLTFPQDAGEAETPGTPAGRPEPVGKDGITAIDAALGDGQAMPADSFGPSAYDLAQRAHRQERAGQAEETESDPFAGSMAPAAVRPPRIPGGSGELLGSDESVTAGD